MQAGLNEKRRKERELLQVTQQIDQVIAAITDGMYHPSLKTKMTALEERKSHLESELADLTEEPLRLHPGLSKLYRKKVADLTASLNVEGSRIEAAEIIRSLLSEIRLVPEGGKLAIELVGALAGIMALSQTSNARSDAAGGSITLVAGVGFEPTTFRL